MRNARREALLLMKLLVQSSLVSCQLRARTRLKVKVRNQRKESLLKSRLKDVAVDVAVDVMVAGVDMVDMVAGAMEAGEDDVAVTVDALLEELCAVELTT